MEFMNQTYLDACNNQALKTPAQSPLKRRSAPSSQYDFFGGLSLTPHWQSPFPTFRSPGLVLSSPGFHDALGCLQSPRQPFRKNARIDNPDQIGMRTYCNMGAVDNHSLPMNEPFNGSSSGCFNAFSVNVMSSNLKGATGFGPPDGAVCSNLHGAAGGGGSDVGVMSSNLKGAVCSNLQGAAGGRSDVGVMSSNLKGTTGLSSSATPPVLNKTSDIMTVKVNGLAQRDEMQFQGRALSEKEPLTSRNMEKIVGRFDEIYGGEISKIWKSTLAIFNDIKNMKVAASNF